MTNAIDMGSRPSWAEAGSVSGVANSVSGIAGRGAAGFWHVVCAAAHAWPATRGARGPRRTSLTP